MADEKNEIQAREEQAAADAAKLRRAGHRRLIKITPDGLLMLIKHGGRVAGNDLPFDVDLVNCGFDLESNSIILTIESETFEAVSDGEPIPMHPPITFRAV